MAALLSRIRWLTLLLIGIVLGLIAAAPAAAGKPGPLPPTRIVCVDAGHGVGDTGAAYGGFEERALTLDIAERLQTLLLANGYGVVMTRTRQTAAVETARVLVPQRDATHVDEHGAPPDARTIEARRSARTLS